MQPAIRERLERCSSLPTLPSVAIRILELCQQEQLDLNQIAAMIANDPALAAKLVKTANSPIFAVRTEVTSISYAVSLLGVNAVRTLVLSFSLHRECSTGNRPGLRDFWRRSVLAALAARELCRDAHLHSRDEAFLCGLLQDIGVLALSRAYGSRYDRVLQESARDHDMLVAAEREVFGADHTEVGAWLLRRWRVPGMLAELVAASHDPRLLGHGGEDVVKLAGVVALSGRFADLWAGDPAKAPARLREELEKKWLPGPVDAAGVTRSLVAQAPQLAPLFEVKLDADEMSSILEQAQEVMLAQSVRTSHELNGIHEALARLESRTATLLADAQRDPLTGVANRGYAQSYLDEVFRAAVESSRPIGVIFADVDHFKAVNDTYGHAAGDSVLQSVAHSITRGVRGGDFVARYGGEEFVIVIRADNADELAIVAERVRHNIADCHHPAGQGRNIPVTISLGCALLDPVRHPSPSALLEEADQALYAAKRSGRNRTQMGVAA